MWRAVREWYIVGIGLFLIAGGLALAAHQNSPAAAVNQAGTAHEHTSPVPEAASRTAQETTPGAMRGTPAPRPPAAPAPAEPPPAPAATAAPAPAPPDAQSIGRSPAPPLHDHMAAADASQTGGQAPAAANAMPAAGGDPVAGRQVFRKSLIHHNDPEHNRT